MSTLRPYQDEMVQRIFREFEAGETSLLAVAPTGSGKTVTFSEVARRRAADGVLIIAHRSEIIDQTSAKLSAIGLQHGIIQAGKDDKLRPYANIQVASIQTLHARAIRTSRMQMPRAGLVIVDEAQHVRAKTYLKVLEQYPNAKVLGFSATPCRGDGRGLGNVFARLIEGPQVQKLIDLGFLVPSVVFSKPVNLRGVRTVAGDYSPGQLEDRMNTDSLVGDVVSQWLKHAPGKPTVIFASGVGHSLHIRDEFVKAGIKAEHIDGATPKDDRDAILQRLAAGETTVVTNCMVLTEGWDCPSVECCVLVRPTKQMGLYRQMIGRVLRPSPGKTRAIVLDHAGAVHNHGKPEDHVEWTLDIDKLAECPEHKARQASGETSMCECSQCGAMRCGGQPCPNCGYLPTRPREYQRFLDVDLVEVGSTNRRPSREEQRQFYAELKGLAQEKNRKAGYTFYKFVDKFGTKPPWDWKDGVPATIPSPQTRAWVRSRDIAWAKSRNNPANEAAA